MPEISVVTPVYNSAPYLRETIQSVLDQSFSDFEFILVDDGSTDNSVEIILSFNDSRIILLRNAQNSGIVTTRNVAISAARGKYIAVLDSDDIAMPTRFEVQRAILESDNSVGLVASWVDIIDENSVRTGAKTRREFQNLEWNVSLLFYNAFTHSSVMVRQTAFSQPAYALALPLCEDYLFISNLARKWKLVVIPEMLTKYRIHRTNISRMKRDLIYDCELQIKAIALEHAYVKCSNEELKLHQKLQSDTLDLSRDDFLNTLLWLTSLVQQLNSNNPAFSSALIPRVLDGVLWEFCQRGSVFGFIAVKLYVVNCKRLGLQLKFARVLKLIAKVIVQGIFK